VDDIKTLSFRMPRPLWLYYKKLAADRDMHLTELMLTILDRYKNNSQKMLQSKDT
jgi:predicted DNA-binding ribbon-helix-helix protein